MGTKARLHSDDERRESRNGVRSVVVRAAAMVDAVASARTSPSFESRSISLRRDAGVELVEVKERREAGAELAQNLGAVGFRVVLLHPSEVVRGQGRVHRQGVGLLDERRRIVAPEVAAV